MISTPNTHAWLDQVKWNDDGLVAAIAQDALSGRVLMMAWMNKESLQLSISSGDAIYWSRSRSKLWRKGESSGHWQSLIELRIDCDGDVLLASVNQEGAACHTERRSCFYLKFEDNKVRII